jgi:uncharacterized membrane protein
MYIIKKYKNIPLLPFVIFLAASAKFIIHILTGTNYGFYANELYTIALSRHLAFGYVDLPPLVPFITALSRKIFGESLLAWRILPALAGGVTMILVCLIAKELGGKAFAVGLAGLAFLVAPVWLIADSYLSYDAYDQLFLAVFLFVLVRLLQNGDRRLWILLGIIAGIACLTKMTLLYFGPGFLIALLLLNIRKDLLTPWPWLGVCVFLILLLPYLIWESANHWPTLEYWLNYGTNKLRAESMNPVLLPLYTIGIWRMARHFKEDRLLFPGLLFLATLLMFIFIHAKVLFLAALFIPLIAAGSVEIEELAERKNWSFILKPVFVSVLIAGGVLVAPQALPILPVEDLSQYIDNFGFMYVPPKDYNINYSKYPINLSLRIGWEEIVRQVAHVYDQLPKEDQKVTGIYAYWYAPASAVDYFGPRYGLPQAVSGHLEYYLWGPRYSWDVMIILIHGQNLLSPFFSECELKGSVNNEYTIELNQLDIYVCRKPIIPPDKIWPQLKTFQ